MPPRKPVTCITAGVLDDFDQTEVETDQLIHEAQRGHVFSASMPEGSFKDEGLDGNPSQR